MNPQLVARVRVILDNGSQRSYITCRVKDMIDLKPENTQCLSIATFGAEKENRVCETVTVVMKMKHGLDQEIVAFVVPHICEPIAPQPLNACIKDYEHLSQLEFADSYGDLPLQVDILIGSDYYWELMTGEIHRSNTGPVAINTKLGWVLSGPGQPISASLSATSLITVHTLAIGAESFNNDDLTNELRSFWELESLGIEKVEKSTHDKFKEDICFKEGRYEVSLPWKEMHDPLSDNYALSLRRLWGLIDRLRENPGILHEYDATIRDQINKGIVEVVPNTETSAGEVHYLPHHAVIRHDKETTKLRVVYDASSRSGGPSLNDCLYTGPKFKQNVFDILLRFRSYRVALTADIEKAFLMISVNQRDRDALRFLWVDNVQQKEPKIITLRFTRVVFGVSSSPFLLNATIRHHLEKFSASYPRLVSCISQSLYVDDLVCGASDEESAYELFVTSKRILSGSFNLRKFTTNSPSLQAVINNAEDSQVGGPEETPRNDIDETYAKSMIKHNQSIDPGGQKILGVYWDVSADQFLFSFEALAALAGKIEPTKRNVVSLVSRFYDPLGLVTPVTICFKMFIQTLCETTATWDQPLTGKHLQKWQSLVFELQDSEPIVIPRYYCHDITGEFTSYELCGFCDASTSAYAAVVYLVIKSSTGRFVRFLTSKTRVAPTQTQTIPRLELLSALLLARLITSITASLNSQLSLESSKCFTDSKVALFWIWGSNKEWKQFVQNRVNEICKLVPGSCWNHCRSQDNPADIPSRGITPKGLINNKMWWSGPDWLIHCPEDNTTEELAMPAECTVEMKVVTPITHSLLTPGSSPSVNLEQLIPCKNYSTLPRLLRVTAYVIRFTRLLKERVETTNIHSHNLEPEEIAEAEKLWILQSQTLLTKDKRFVEWKQQFGLFLDQMGIWRCGGRLVNAELQYNTKHPIFISKYHHLAVLIVRGAHERVFHNGVKDTLTEVRAKYWIVQGRSLVKGIIQRCAICRRFEGRSYGSPAPPPLPDFRVSEAPPFSTTGVDFAGPLYIRTHGLIKSNKVWICLYTCCVTRAVSIDIVPDMSTETFICSLKRFCARRGLPHRFISDNGKSFKAAAKVIKGIVSDRDVRQYLSKISVEGCLRGW